MQMAGLALGPLAIVLQMMTDQLGRPLISVKELLVAGVAALCLFWIGRIVEGYARP